MLPEHLQRIQQLTNIASTAQGTREPFQNITHESSVPSIFDAVPLSSSDENLPDTDPVEVWLNDTSKAETRKKMVKMLRQVSIRQLDREIRPVAEALRESVGEFLLPMICLNWFRPSILAQSLSEYYIYPKITAWGYIQRMVCYD